VKPTRETKRDKLKNSVLFSSESCEWETPQSLFDALNERFESTLDVCATPENAKCGRYYTPEDNGLLRGWWNASRPERCWMNPPYGREIAKWVEKARNEAELGALVVGLLPARTDARWWQKHVQGHADTRFIAGRLKFGNCSNCKNSATFPSAIAVWWGWPCLAGKWASTENSKSKKG
jgi:site-specific DNA-methyltransferase (adenine-specific)